MYYHPRNAMVAAMNLLSFAYLQFAGIVRWDKRAVLYKLSESIKLGDKPDMQMIAVFAFEHLSDSIKLTICFENLMKSMLLLNGYLIHKIDEAKIPDLAKEQLKRPILLSEFGPQPFYQNEKLESLNPLLRKQIKGVMNTTIGMKQLLSKNYKRFININQRVLNICVPYFQYRNNVHLYMGELPSFSDKDYENIVLVARFIDDSLVRIQNEIVDKLGIDNTKKLRRLSD